MEIGILEILLKAAQCCQQAVGSGLSVFLASTSGLALVMIYTDQLFMKMKKCYITFSAISGKSEGHFKNCYLDWLGII
jgi:hypothetical protein